MKKTELVVGVEYACTMQPYNSRSRYEPKPFKATLVSLDFTEKRYKRSNGWEGLYSESTENGIAVDMGAPVEYDIQVGVSNANGPIFVTEPNYGRRRMTKEAKASYPYVILKNAGCFLMTWAAWEQEEQDAKDAVVRRANEHNAQAKARKAEEARVLLDIAEVKEVLSDIGRVVVESDEWRGDNVPDDLYVLKPGATHHYDSIIHAEYLHGEGPKGERVVTGLRLKDTNLGAILAIINAAKGV